METHLQSSINIGIQGDSVYYSSRNSEERHRRANPKSNPLHHSTRRKIIYREARQERQKYEETKLIRGK